MSNIPLTQIDVNQVNPQQDGCSGYGRDDVDDDQPLTTSVLRAETVVMDAVINNRVGVYVQHVNERLTESFVNSDLTHSRCGHILLLMKDAMDNIIFWFNEKMRLRRDGVGTMDKPEFIKFIAITLHAHSTGLSIENVIRTIQRHGRNVPSLQRIRFILLNLCAYHPTHSHDIPKRTDNIIGRTWFCQRDRTRFLVELERSSFSVSRRLFYVPSSQTITIDDGLFGSRAKDKSVPNLNDRKEAGEGEFADVVADASFRFCLGVRFNRRGEAKIETFNKLLDEINEWHGELSQRSCIVTIDRGSGRDDFSDALRRRGYSFIFIAPDYPMFCHPFTGLSCLHNRREDDISRHDSEEPPSEQGFCSEDEADETDPIYHDLFGEVPATIKPDDKVLQIETKRVITQAAHPLTRGQRCADWFVLRKFRVTGTLSGTILQRDDGIRDMLKKAREVEKWCTKQWMRKFYESWFSTAKSTEYIQRGSANEDSCFASLSSLPFIRTIYSCGLLQSRSRPYHAASPDGIALVSQSFVQEQTSWQCTQMCNVDNKSYVISPVVIKTVVAGNTVAGSTTLLSTEPLLKRIDDEDVIRTIDTSHILQMMHQCYILQTNLCLYALCTETRLQYLGLFFVSNDILKMVESALDTVTNECLRWAHEPNPRIPSNLEKDIRDMFTSYLPMWSVINDAVQDGPLCPVRHFRHGVQLFYSKEEGGVDGLTHYQSALCSHSAHLKWEQSITMQMIKTIAVNSFISYRFLELKQRGHVFKSLDCYRRALNTIQSFPDFTSDAMDELLTYADGILKDTGAIDEDIVTDTEQSTPTTPAPLSRQATQRLISQAKIRKRNRFPFFNSADGKRLRLQTGTHVPQRINQQKWCVLCGCTTKTNRGFKTHTQCPSCNAALCTKIHSGYLRSCFHEWHCISDLSMRGRPVSTTTTHAQPTTPSPRSAVPPPPSPPQDEDSSS